MVVEALSLIAAHRPFGHSCLQRQFRSSTILTTLTNVQRHICQRHDVNENLEISIQPILKYHRKFTLITFGSDAKRQTNKPSQKHNLVGGEQSFMTPISLRNLGKLSPTDVLRRWFIDGGISS